MVFRKGSKILLLPLESFTDITKPLREAKKKIEERQVNSLVHKTRSKNKLF